MPDTLRTHLTLDRAERVLGEAEAGEGWAVATDTGLHLLSEDRGVFRPWTDVDHAAVARGAEEMEVVWLTGGTDRLPLAGRAGRRLAQLVNERVSASVVRAEKIRVPGGTVRVAVRRGADGAMFSQVTAVGDVDPQDPATSSAIDGLEARLREVCGLTS